MSSAQSKPRRGPGDLRHLALYAMFGALLFGSKELMALLPNIHLLALLIATFTVVYRKYALIPVYLYALLEGVLQGFSLWWVPNLYIWTLLWAAVMLLPKNMKPAAAVPVYMAVCGLHGFLYGVLWAPWQMLVFGLSFKGTLAWIASGLPFDIAHGVSNLILGALVLPLSQLLTKLEAGLQK